MASTLLSRPIQAIGVNMSLRAFSKSLSKSLSASRQKSHPKLRAAALEALESRRMMDGLLDDANSTFPDSSMPEGSEIDFTLHFVSNAYEVGASITWPGGFASDFTFDEMDVPAYGTVDDNGSIYADAATNWAEIGWPYIGHWELAEVYNVAPTGTFGSRSVPANKKTLIGFTDTDDPSAADLVAGLHYSFATDPGELASDYESASASNTLGFAFDSPGEYTVYARVFDKDDDYSCYSAEFTVTDPVPDAPADLTYMSADGNFSWTDSSGETGYRVEASAYGSIWTSVATPSANTTAQALVDGYIDNGYYTAYRYFRVYAVNSEGDSDPSAVFDRYAANSPSIEPGPAVRSGAISKLDLSNLAIGHTYKIQRSTSSDFSSDLATVATGFNSTVFTDTGLNPDTTYYYRVRVTSVDADSVWYGVETTTSSFIAYQAINARNIGTIPGMSRLQLYNLGNLDSGQFNPDGSVTSATLADIVAQAQSHDHRIVFDWEIGTLNVSGETFTSPFTESGLSDSNIERMENLVDAVKGVDATIQIGFYGLGALIEPGDYASSYGFDWTNADASLSHFYTLLHCKVDFVCPELYAKTDDLQEWGGRALKFIEQAKTFGKPVYPFLMPHYHEHAKPGGGTLMPADKLRAQLELVGQAADGVIFWKGSSEEWDRTDGSTNQTPHPWVTELNAFLSHEIGTGSISGLTIQTNGSAVSGHLSWSSNTAGTPGFLVYKCANGSSTWTYAGLVLPGAPNVWDDPVYTIGGSYQYKYTLVPLGSTGSTSWGLSTYTTGTYRYAAGVIEAADYDAVTVGTVFNSSYPQQFHRHVVLVSSTTTHTTLRYDDVDFGAGADQFTIAIGTPGHGLVDVYKDGVSGGNLLGTIETHNDDAGNGQVWWTPREYSGSITSVSGVHDLYLVFRNASNTAFDAGIDWFAFNQAPSQAEGVSAVFESGDVRVDWSSNSSDATNWIIERTTDPYGEWTQIGTASSETYLDTDTLVASQLYYYRVIAENSHGQSIASTPAPYLHSSLGTFTGSYSAGQSTFGGALVGGSGDYAIHADNGPFDQPDDDKPETPLLLGTGYYFGYKVLTGNFTITTQVSLGAGVNSAGLMVRTSLDDSDPFDPFAALALSSRYYLGEGVRYMQANSSGAAVPVGNYDLEVTSYWLRFTRTGSTLVAECSADGSTWTTVSSPYGGVSVGSGSVYVGLFASRRGDTDYQLASAEFSNVCIT